MITLPDYTLIETLYESSTMIHHRGRRDVDQLPVTIKLLKGQYPKRKDLIRLRHEHAIINYLKIPGIIKSFAVKRYENTMMLVMEDVVGRPLSDVIASQRLSIRAVLQIGVAISDTLEQIHQRHVIHKDIKPHNVLVDLETGRVTLIDFGIATRLPREVQRAGNPTTLEGTLAYMAPEQTGRMNRVVDVRADLYALGVTIYEMLVGALPFQQTDPLALLHSHIARSPTPPHQIVPEVPITLSDIVMKLLAKTAEDRYQRSSGLKADLEKCLAQWDATGSIAPFPIARHDQTGELRLPQKLYGREPELATLMAAFERVGGGATELLLVSGYSGVGKSALVHEVHKGIARQQGYFISGKFDQLSRSIPYAPVARAFGELIRLVMTERPELVATWREKLLTALGSNGQVLLDVFPDVELLIGSQPPVQELGPSESQNRFNLVFQGFLRVFTTGKQTLVLFLDDLQWADAASLRLLHLILTDPESGALLLIGAYRDNEVDQAHPLTVTLDELRKTGVCMNTIMLQPLELTHVHQCIADALSCDASFVVPLAELVWRKTDGNPFFMSQFLLALHQRKLLAHDPISSSWQWDMPGIHEMPNTENVVVFMASKLRRLTPNAQQVLSLAACIGHQFDLMTLSTIRETPPVQTAVDLWEALSEGLIVPLDSDYKFYHALTDQDGGLAEADLDLNVSYKFLHDRVQQAAYSLIEGGRERHVHLRIGRLLLERSGRVLGDERLYDVVHHLNFAAELIDDPRERLELAQWDMRAGKNAKAATANEAASSYLTAGMALIDGDGWTTHYDLTFALHSELAECEYLNNRFDAAERLFDITLSRATTTLDSALIHNLRIILYATLGRFGDAIAAGRAGLALFGIDLPEGDDALRAAVAAELAEAELNLAGRRVEDLFSASPITDESKIAALKLLMNVTAPAYLTDPTRLYILVAGKQVNISLKYGQSEISDHAYMSYGYVLGGILGRYKEGYEFGRLALDLNEKLNNVQQACKLNFLFAIYIHSIKHIRLSLPYSERSHRIGLETGDFVYTSFNCWQTIIVRFGSGEDIHAVQVEVDKFLALMQRTKNALATVFLTIAKQVIACLKGDTQSRYTLSDGQFNEDEFVAWMESADFALTSCWYYALKAQVFYLHGDYAAAFAMATLGKTKVERCVGYYFTTELPFYGCLAATALHATATPAQQQERSGVIARDLAKIRELAESCPENYRHKQLLVEAELARVSGRDTDAAALYDEAIGAARKNEFTHHEAIASELCANFYTEKGRRRIALAYMTDAYYGYKAWGAAVKVADIAARFPAAAFHVEATATPAVAPVNVTLATSTLTDQAIIGKFDLKGIVRATEAIVTETVLEKVLERWMGTVIEIAGAQRGFVTLVSHGVLTVRASIAVNPDMVTVDMSVPLEMCAGDLAVAVVQYVANTCASVVLDDVTQDSRFAHDPYVAANQPKSIVCIAMLYQSALVAILYLESGSIAHAFSALRVELLELLSSQAAIAIGNALMVDRVQQMSEELRRANETLEQQVTFRTGELLTANQRLERELAERARVEAARATLQQEVIEIQKTMLLELSTPLIPIADGVMVMPLVGSMDTRRAEQVLETVLRGVQSNRAAVVIIDITGIRLVDESVANTLLNAARALRMLGAEAVLTGIRPEVAQTLVGLNADLGSVVVRGTLQIGIAYALEKSGRAARLGREAARQRRP